MVWNNNMWIYLALNFICNNHDERQSVKYDLRLKVIGPEQNIIGTDFWPYEKWCQLCICKKSNVKMISSWKIYVWDHLKKLCYQELNSSEILDEIQTHTGVSIAKCWIYMVYIDWETHYSSAIHISRMDRVWTVRTYFRNIYRRNPQLKPKHVVLSEFLYAPCIE